MVAYDHAQEVGDFAAYIDDVKIGSRIDTLEDCIESYKDVQSAGYSKASFEQFGEALKMAKAAAADPIAGEYERDAAKNNLQQAYDGLTKLTDATKTVYAHNFSSFSGYANPDRDSNGNPYTLGNIVDTTYVSYKGLDFGEKGANVLRTSHSGKDTQTTHA